MVKYCPKCEMEISDDELFCEKCHTPLYEKNSNISEKNDTGVTDRYYDQIFLDTHHRKRRSRMITVLIAFAIIALIISFSLWVAFFDITMTPEVTKIYSRNDGPKVSLQLSSTGSASPIPEENYYATYGYYYENNKVGEATTEIVGNEIYNNINCVKTKTSGDMEITIIGSSVDYTFETYEYRNQENYIPVYSTTEYEYLKPLQFTQSSETIWDLENLVMTYTTLSMGQTSTISSYLPDEFTELFDFSKNLKVGYSDEITYIMDMGMESYSDIEVKLILSVTNQEDVNVQNGYYENCFVVELVQNYQILGLDQEMKIKMWITDDGIMPKQEVSIPLVGNEIVLSVELDEYYTTSSPDEHSIA